MRDSGWRNERVLRVQHGQDVAHERAVRTNWQLNLLGRRWTLCKWVNNQMAHILKVQCGQNRVSTKWLTHRTALPEGLKWTNGRSLALLNAAHRMGLIVHGLAIPRREISITQMGCLWNYTTHGSVHPLRVHIGRKGISIRLAAHGMQLLTCWTLNGVNGVNIAWAEQMESDYALPESSKWQRNEVSIKVAVDGVTLRTS